MLINWLFILVVFVSSGWITFWSFLDSNPPSIILEEKVLNDGVPAGGILQVKYRIDRKRSCRVQLEQIILDSQRQRFFVGQNDYIVAPGNLGLDEFVIPVKVPEDATPGMAIYRAIRGYLCNPMQRLMVNPIIVVAPDLKFMISERINK